MTSVNRYEICIDHIILAVILFISLVNHGISSDHSFDLIQQSLRSLSSFYSSSSYSKLTTYEFCPWPHRKIFNGYLKEGIWIAGDISSASKRLLNLDIQHLDKIQSHAIKEGIYFPNLKIFPKYHLFSSEEANQCIEGKNIYFFGDSYIQQMFIGMVDVLTNDPSNIEITNGSYRITIVEEMSKKINKFLGNRANVKFVMEACKHGDLKCVFNELESHQNYRKADVLIGNILVHHMTMHQQEKDYLHEYTIQLQSLLQRSEELHLTWATGPSYTINRVPKQYLNATLSRPTEYMNFRAIEIAKELDCPLLDLFSLTHSCKWKNCSSDGGHRSRFVNRMKAQMLLNNICQQKHDLYQ